MMYALFQLLGLGSYRKDTGEIHTGIDCRHFFFGYKIIVNSERGQTERFEAKGVLKTPTSQILLLA